MMADHVTNRILRDKACRPSGRKLNFRAASGPCGGPFNACPVARGSNSVTLTAIRLLFTTILFGGVELNVRAAANPQHLMDRDGCGAKHHGDPDGNFVECGHLCFLLHVRCDGEQASGHHATIPQ